MIAAISQGASCKSKACFLLWPQIGCLAKRSYIIIR